MWRKGNKSKSCYQISTASCFFYESVVILHHFYNTTVNYSLKRDLIFNEN